MRCPNCDRLVFYSCGGCSRCLQDEADYPGQALVLSNPQNVQLPDDVFACPHCGHSDFGGNWGVLEIEQSITGMGVDTLTEAVEKNEKNKPS